MENPSGEYRCGFCHPSYTTRKMHEIESSAETRSEVSKQKEKAGTGATGCNNCKLLAHAIRLLHPDDPIGDEMQVRIWMGGVAASRYNIRLWRKNRPNVDGLYDWEIFTLPELTPLPWPNGLPSRLLSGDTSSETSFQTAHSWLNNCLRNHSQCKLTMKSRLPPRLVEVDGLCPNSIRIIETDEKQVGTYLCLSHCWGPQDPSNGVLLRPTACSSRSTISNIEKRKQELFLSDLPQTFRDAIDFTRRLGQRYIWIDSLCIVQDDKNDWLRHAKDMSTIYENSHLTLAATWAQDGTEGCYRVADSYKATKLPELEISGKSYSIYGRRPLPHWWTGKMANGLGFYNEVPLLTRAWIFQERMLSPRVLHFGPAELLWECMEESTCECTSGLFEYKNHTKAQHAAALKLCSEKQTSALWRDLVVEFSGLRITEPSDRLPAVMGILKQLSNVSPSRVIAGLWENSLLYDLLWQVHYTKFHVRRDYQLLYPSWSWMSLGSRVYYRFTKDSTFKPRATIENVSIDPSRGIDESILCWATITISAYIIPIKLSKRPHHVSKRPHNAFYAIPCGISDFETKQWYTTYDLDQSNAKRQPWCLKQDVDYKSDERGLTEGEVVYCMWMCSIAGLNPKPFHCSDEYEALLVIRAVDEEKNIYERVGCVDHLSWHNPIPPLETLGTRRTVTLV